MGGEGKPELSKEWLRSLLERERERESQPVMEWVMCPTCCGFVCRKKRSGMPNPDDDGEVEMLADAKEMRAAVMPEHPLDEEVMEPDAATEIHCMRTRMILEHERCPTCYRPLSDTHETKPCKEDKMVAADSGSKRMVEMVAADETMNKRSEEDGRKENKRSKEGKNKKKRSKKQGKNKKKRSKNKNKRSMEDPRGGEQLKMVASQSEGEAMVADLGSREDSTEYSMGCTLKSSSESNESPMGKSSSSESKESPMGKSSSSESKEAPMGKSSSSESNEAPMGKSSSSESNEYSMGPTGKRRTKMVTCRLSKDFVQEYIRTSVSPFLHMTNNHLRALFSRQIAEYEVKCELHAYWQRQCDMKGYADYQEEVTDDEYA